MMTAIVFHLFVWCMTMWVWFHIFSHVLVGSYIFQGRFFILLGIKRFLSYFGISSMDSISPYLFVGILFGQLRFVNLSFIGAMRRRSVSWRTNQSSFIVGWQIFGRRWAWPQGRWQSFCFGRVWWTSINKFTIFIHCQFFVIIDRCWYYLFAYYLFLGFVKGFDDFMIEDLFNGESFVWVEYDHFFEEVSEVRTDIFEEICGFSCGWNFYLFYHGFWHLWLKGLNILFWRISCEETYLFYLVQGWISREKGFLCQNLVQDTAETPNISGSGIRFGAK